MRTHEEKKMKSEIVCIYIYIFILSKFSEKIKHDFIRIFMNTEESQHLFEKYLSYAVALLSAREYSRKLLQEKIETKFLKISFKASFYASEKKKKQYADECFIDKNKQIITEVLNFLTEKKYLDEQRTAENFLRYRREYSPRGRRMIAQNMYKKKIDSEISQQVLAEFSEEEEQHDCNLLARKKWEQISSTSTGSAPDTQKVREKLTRFLAGKGFPYSMIQNSWEEVSEE